MKLLEVVEHRDGVVVSHDLHLEWTVLDDCFHLPCDEFRSRVVVLRDVPRNLRA